MLKRIAIVAFFTGSGQLLSIFVLKYLSRYSDATQLKAIAEIDSLVFFIMNLIALGLQSAAIRNLALSQEWKKEYYDTQSARITLGILLMAAAGLAFINTHYILFLIAPLLAWNGDYALYARGHPIVGSIVAFTRLAVPFLALLVVVKDYPAYLAWAYLISLAVVYIVTNAFISYFLKTSPLFKPSFKSLRLYISTLSLGIVSVSLYFLGLGLILVIPYFYGTAVVATAFIGLKFYMIFKGVLRIIHQAFIKEMRSYEVCFKVDQLCTLIGLTFAAFPICFPNTFISLFFGPRYLADKPYFIVLSVAGLIYSLFSSLTTKAMLEKKDNTYAKVAGFSALLSIALTIIFSFTWPGVLGIGVSLLVGEVVFCCGMIWLMQNSRILRERMVFIAKNIALAIIPLTVAYFMGDEMKAFWIALVPFGLMMILLYYNKFNLPNFNEQMQPAPNDSFLMRQSFQPGFASLFVNPLYLIRRSLFLHIKQQAPKLSGRLLDFGCGRKPYQNLFKVSEYVGVDIEQSGHDHSSSQVDVYYDGKQLPFADNSFDSLFCGEVLEHVFNADEIVPELHRVLKPGGHGLFTVPFCWNEHEAPYDYARYTSYGIQHLLEKNGFEVIELKKSGVFAQVMFQLWALYFWEVFSRWKRAGHILSLIFIIPTNFAGAVFGRIFPRNNSLYFNNIVLVRKA